MYRKRKPITDEEIAFVKENYQSMTIPKMAETLKITQYRAEQIMKKLELIPTGGKGKTIEIDWENDNWNDEIHRKLYPLF